MTLREPGRLERDSTQEVANGNTKGVAAVSVAVTDGTKGQILSPAFASARYDRSGNRRVLDRQYRIFPDGLWHHRLRSRDLHVLAAPQRGARRSPVRQDEPDGYGGYQGPRHRLRNLL